MKNKIKNPIEKKNLETKAKSLAIPHALQSMGKQLVNFITCGCESSAPFL
jgi:hypothetical protein